MYGHRATIERLDCTVRTSTVGDGYCTGTAIRGSIIVSMMSVRNDYYNFIRTVR